MSEKSSVTISIDAPIADVSKTLFEIEGYPEWSGAIKKVAGVEKDGSGQVVKATLTIDAGAVKDEVVLSYDWSAAPGTLTFALEDGNFLTKMDGAYILKALDADTTQVTYELSVGLGMPIPQMMITKQEKSTIDLALKQLKEHLEG